MIRTRLGGSESLRERVRSHLDGTLEAADPRPAATVVLLRDAPGGPEVYLLLRRRSMAFAAGVHVFPGGGVDATDHAEVPGWTGPDAAWWAERFGVDDRTAHALVVAAVRETFEEAGVLLAGPDGADVDAEPWEPRRAGLVAHEHGLADVLADAGLGLRADLLAPWSRWITPEPEPRRYDTAFFLAALPAGQQARDVSTESTQVRWVPLRQAAEDTSIAMMPPTRVTCADLADSASVAEALALATDRPAPLVLPRMVLDGDEVWVERDEEDR